MKRPMNRQQDVFVFAMPSVTGAMRAKRMLTAGGFRVSVEKESRPGRGCGYVLKLWGNSAARRRAGQLLSAAGLLPEEENREGAAPSERGG